MRIEGFEPGKQVHGPRPMTGSVYGGNAMEGGYAMEDGERVVLTFVSDSAGAHGGPYYWVGWTRPDGGLAAGVRSVSRGLLMKWQASRPAR